MKNLPPPSPGLLRYDLRRQRLFVAKETHEADEEFDLRLHPEADFGLSFPNRLATLELPESDDESEGLFIGAMW